MQRRRPNLLELQLKLKLQNRFYDTWDGKLPQVVGSNDMLIDIPINRGE